VSSPPEPGVAVADVAFRIVAGAAAGLVLFGAAGAEDGRGFVLYQQNCRTCHTVVAGDHRLGPSLHGVVGSAAGRAAGFHYSRTMAGANVVWDAATLDAFLADPTGFMPGNAMLYQGMADAANRAAVIAYLAEQR
jgi:cytochrome c